MAWGAQTWLQIYPELAYGVRNTSPTPKPITLHQSNAFTVRRMPLRQIIRTADGSNRRKFVVANRQQFQGNLNTLFHADQATFWATAIQPVGTVLATGHSTLSGATVGSATVDSPGAGYPPTTPIPVSFVGGGGSGAYGTVTSSGGGTITGSITVTAPGSGYLSPPGVIIGGMPSYTIEFWDGIQAWRLNGCVFPSLSVSATPAGDFTALSLPVIAQGRDTSFTTFTQPAAAGYSASLPFAYIESAGQVKLATVPISSYRVFGFSIKNQLVPIFDENATISAVLYAGRDLDFNLGPQYWTSTLRGYLESQTALTWSIGFNRTSPAHSFSINCETATYLSDVADDIPLNGPSYQAIGAQVFYDAANSNDFVITAT